MPIDRSSYWRASELAEHVQNGRRGRLARLSQLVGRPNKDLIPNQPLAIMSTLLRRSVPDLDLLRQSMDRLFTDTVATTTEGTSPSWAPRADVVESDDSYHIVLDLPGITQDKLEVNFEDGTLSVNGERAVREEYSKGRFHRVERSYGRFFRSFSLGTDIDAEKIDASFHAGVLTIDVPKAEARKPRQISVRGAAAVEANQTEEAELVEA